MLYYYYYYDPSLFHSSTRLKTYLLYKSFT